MSKMGESSSSSRAVEADQKSVAVHRGKREAGNVFNEICRFQQKKKMKISETCTDTEQQQITDTRAMGIHFQEEILMDILSKLPVRSLLRFKFVSKSWKTLIADPYVKMKGKLSAEEMMDIKDNISCYLFRLQEGLSKDNKVEFKEIMDKYPLSELERELLGYDSGSDVYPSEDYSTEDEGSTDEENDSEEVNDNESDEGSDDDDEDDDDGKMGKLSAEEMADCMDRVMCYFSYSVPVVEGFYKDRKADLKEIQDKQPLSRRARQLLGYDSEGDVHPSKDDNTKDERATVDEHDSEEVDASESRDGSDNGDDADDDTFDSAGAVA